jgi:hypothetical protein
LAVVRSKVYSGIDVGCTIGIIKNMHKYQWSTLTKLQLGRCAEYFVKMEFALHGFDVYTAEWDDKGIDFIVRRDTQRYYDVQVKSSRDLSYIFFLKDKFTPRENLLAAIVLFKDGEHPGLYLVPSTVWIHPNSLFVSRDYEGKKSKPEWGLQLSHRNLSQLKDYEFACTVGKL